MNKKDGMNYAPKGKVVPVVKPGEFNFSVIGLDHGHIYGMVNGLTEAGALLHRVYDPDPVKVAAFLAQYPNANVALTEDEVLLDPEVQLIAAAAIPNTRAALGARVMHAGKDYFTDKPPLTTLGQLDMVKKAAKETGRKYTCYFSERLHVESAVFASKLVNTGAIGRVIQTIGMGPHRLNEPSRPDWFFDIEQYGGILCDIGSHQIEQFLFFTGATDAVVLSSKTGNYNCLRHPYFEDFGDATLLGNNGATGYFRMDWFTPNGLPTWGDGRIFLLGTRGYIEIRKYLDVARDDTSDHVYWVNDDGMHYRNAASQLGFPFFGELILDCLNRTEKAMTQAHIFKVAELCVKAQCMALDVTKRNPG